MMSGIVPGLAPLPRVPVTGGGLAPGSTLEISTMVTVGQYQAYLCAIGGCQWTLAVRDPGTGDFEVVDRRRDRCDLVDAGPSWLSRRLTRQFLSSRDSGERIEIELGGLIFFKVTNPNIPEGSPDRPMCDITWWEMLAFAAAHGGDLPMGAEYRWEIRKESWHGWVWTKDRPPFSRVRHSRLRQWTKENLSPRPTDVERDGHIIDGVSGVVVWRSKGTR